MTRKIFSLLSAAVLVIVLGSMAKADTINLTQDHCTGGCNPGSPGTSMGTVTLTQNGLNDVLVTVTLVSPLQFVNTGLQDVIDFNLVGTPTISASNFTNTHFLLDSGTAGSNHFDGFGDFNYAIGTNTGNGAGGAQSSPLSFDITCSSCGLTVSSFLTNGSGANVWFGVDVYNSTLNTTGPIGGGGSSPVPEPGSLALFGTGLLSMAGFLKRKLLA